jgi:3-phosphoinositide dependent protein kinase-1
MDELRAHPFFVSIRWDTLWDDPAPPLETGLVRREPVPVDEWDDVGATWDELVGGPDASDDEDEDDGSSEGPHAHAHAHVRLRAPGDDGIEWASDAQAYVSPPAIPPEEIGPHGEMPDYARQALPLLGAINGVDAADVAAGDGDIEDARGGSAEHADGTGTVSGTHGIHFALPGIDRVSKNTGPGSGAVVADNSASATDEATGSGVRPGPGHGPGPGPGKDEDEEQASPVSSSTEVGDAPAAPGEEPPKNSAPLRVPRAGRDSYATSSSDGSPVEKLSAALEAMGIHRGRLRTRSPTPARDTPPSASVEAPDWYAPTKQLFLSPKLTFPHVLGRQRYPQARRCSSTHQSRKRR